ncbi:MAG: hypothetical protein WB723_01895 [Candidatus Acidiferrales bacterium]
MTIIEAILGFAGLVASYYFGFRQGKTAERNYQLSLKQATPRIGTRMEFFKLSSETDTGHLRRFSIETTIYNDGSLVASKLEGNWKLSSSYGFLDVIEIIREDSLPIALPIKRNHDLGYHAHDAFSKPQIVLQADIDLVYLGLDNKKEQYHVTYEYDPKSGKMIQSGSKQ